ncbi:uncharacterized protein L201_000037 [Kwoniella dendrophila CBS 6074]|uniref:ASST-domain-containing protein n=1 Tax=Kwoniella dendrophila CBS 6074 TaxID=1295534 RepID=A0AAX4JI98_9TREE
MISPILALCSILPLSQAVYQNSAEYSSGALGASPAQSFHSVNYTVVDFNINVPASSELSPGYLFLAPRGTDVATPAPLIMTNQGDLIWDGTEYGYTQSMAFQVSTYQQQGVITLWQGQFNGAGYGIGYGLVLDQGYNVVANVTTTIEGSGVDFHEFYITDNDTALLTVYINEEYDLTSYNVTTSDGSKGWILGGAFQEIEVSTGEALFTWKSLDHVDPNLCHASPGDTGTATTNPWDYFHINSIEKDNAGNYLISSRHCHAVYYISKDTGEILWSIGGKNSTFTMGDKTNFEWQHMARWQDNFTRINLFDNAATSWESDETMARGLLLNIDQSNRSVTLETEYLPWNQTVASSQGSMELQSNGNWLLGWGQNPFFSEYTSDGTLLSSTQFGVGNVQSYRVLRSEWIGYPSKTSPRISLNSNATTSQIDIYTSWNGATEVSSWQLLGSNSTDIEGQTITQTNKTSFETKFSIDLSTLNTYQWIQTKALNSNGSILGYSNFLSLNGDNSTETSNEQEKNQITLGTSTPTFTSSIKASSTAATTTGNSNSSKQSNGQTRLMINTGCVLLSMISVAALL